MRTVETFVGVCGSKYEGEVKNGECVLLLYHWAHCDDNSFCRLRMDGRGKFTMSNNNIYIGEMKDGQ